MLDTIDPSPYTVNSDYESLKHKIGTKEEGVVKKKGERGEA